MNRRVFFRERFAFHGDLQHVAVVKLQMAHVLDQVPKDAQTCFLDFAVDIFLKLVHERLDILTAGPADELQ